MKKMVEHRIFQRIVSLILSLAMAGSICLLPNVSGIQAQAAEADSTAERFALNYETIDVNLDNSYDLPLYLTVGYYTEPSGSGKITWESSNKTVATVNADGRLHALKAGKTDITAKHADHPGKTATCQVTVYDNKECTVFYYVSPNGADTNPGTEKAPFATVQKARDTIRSMKKLPEGGITVILEDGKYYQNETLVFTPEDSGTKECPIVYKARNEGKAIITGEKAINDWKPMTDENEWISETAKGKIFVADVEQGWRFHDLYVNGERQQVSRSFNTDKWRDWPVFYGRAPLSYDSKKGARVVFGAGELDGLEGNEDVELILLPVMYWNTIPLVKHIDAASRTAYLQSQIPSNFWPDSFGRGEGYYNILNTLKYLDEPGEWCIDSKAGKVYYWPKNEETINTDEIVAPKPYELIRLQGDGVDKNFQNIVKYITFDGLSFHYTDRLPENEFPEDWILRQAENPDASIYFDGAAHCRVINSEIGHSGAYGVTVNHYGQYNEFLHNQLYDLGSGGIQFYGYGVGTVDATHHNLAMFNTVYKMGVAPYQHSPGLSVFGSGCNTMAYNYIAGAPYAGISIVGTDENSISKVKPNTRAAYDMFGNQSQQYGIRFEDLEKLPQSELDGKNGEYFSIETLAEKYQHSERNVAEYNILDDYSQSMDDGGALYSWYSGLGNVYAYNVLKEQLEGARTWVFRLYMDDRALGFTLDKNLCTGNFNATIDKSKDFAPYKNRWIGNEYAKYPAVPAGYNEQRAGILKTVQDAFGGYKLAESKKPVILSPAKGSTAVKIPTTFVLDQCGNASQYTIEIAKDSAFKEVVDTITTRSTTALSNKLDYSTKYYARVTTREYLAEPQLSDVISFTTDKQNPPAEPVRGVKLTNDIDAVLVQWDQVAKNCVNVYRKGPDDTDFVLLAEKVSGNGYLDSQVKVNSAYTYYVEPVNAAGVGPKSDEMSITTRELNVLFSDNFDSGKISDLWTYKDGSKVNANPNNAVIKDGQWATTEAWKEYFVGLDEKWGDYAVEADLTFDGLMDGAESYSAFGLISRARSTGNGGNQKAFYQFLVRDNNTTMEIQKCVDGAWTMFKEIDTGVKPQKGSLYRMRFENIGKNMRVYLNGVLLAELEDGALKNGGVGIGTGKEHILVDNVRVSQPKQYAVNVDAAITNGKVIVDRTHAAEGQAVSIKVEPELGYMLQEGSLKVNGKPISGTLFTMPKGDVTVSAVFEKDPQGIPVQSVSLDHTSYSLENGKSFKLKCTVLPATATNKEILWSSNNEQVATVDKQGNVTTKQAGFATIIAKSAANPALQAQCVVEVFDAVADQTTFYVATDGADTNDGSKAKPFATIQRARDEVRKQLASGQVKDVVVYVKGGTYYLTDEILLTEADSAKEGQTITYRSYEGEARLVGGTPVTGWTDENGDGIFEADVTGHNDFWALFDNGKRMTSAKETNWQNKDFTVDANSHVQAVYRGNWFGEVLRVTSRSGNTIKTEIPVGGYSGGVQYLQGHKAFIDQPGEWALDGNTLYYKPVDGTVEGHEIIAPTCDRIFNLKGSSPKTPVCGIRIEGFSLEMNDFGPNIIAHSGHDNKDSYEYESNLVGMVTMDNAQRNVVKDCEMLNSGYLAVAINHYGKNNTIYGNNIENTGFAGMFLFGGNPGTLFNYNQSNIISNNRIRNVGEFVNYGSGIYLINSGKNTITHNDIAESPRYGISMKGVRYGAFEQNKLPDVSFDEHWKYNQTTENYIGYNILSNCGANSADGGGVESWGCGPRNVIDHNIVYNAYTGIARNGWRGHSIFLDDASHYSIVTNNIVYDEKAAAVNASVMMKSIGNYVYNNVFDVAYATNGAITLGAYVCPSNDMTFEKNIVYTNAGGALNDDGSFNTNGNGDRNMFVADDSKTVGNIVDLMEVMDNNVYYNGAGNAIFKFNKQSLTFDQWKAQMKRLDQHSILADPLFVDAANRDYRLKVDSPALNLGIAPIDASEIGLKTDFVFGKPDTLRNIYINSGNGNTLYTGLALNDTVKLRVTGRSVQNFVVEKFDSLTFTSSDNNIASVTADGVVTAKGKGTATITAKAVCGAVTKTAAFTIYAGDEAKAIQAENMTLTLKENEQGKVHAAVVTAGGKVLTDSVYTYEAINPEIASVSETGIVYAHQKGTAQIKVSTTMGGKKLAATISVTVKEAEAVKPDTRNLYERTNAITADKLKGARVDNGVLGYTSYNGYACFHNVDFGADGAKRFAVSIASPHDPEGFGIEVRLDSPDGTIIGSVPGKNTGAHGKYETLIGDIAGQADGVHDVYFIFGKNQPNLKWVQFSQNAESQKIEAMEVTGDEAIFLPETGNAQYPFAAVGRDEIDAQVTNIPAVWSLDKTYAGISIDAKTGVVTVTDKAPKETTIQVIAALRDNPEIKAQMNVLVYDGKIVVLKGVKCDEHSSDIKYDGEVAGYISNGAWLKFANVDAGTGVEKVEVRYANPNKTENAQLKFEPTADAEILANVACPKAGPTWQNFAVVNAPVTAEIRGVHDLYVYFTGSMNFDYMKLYIPRVREIPDTVNKAALQAAVNAAKTYEESKYTPETWSVFADALKNAKGVLDNKQADQVTVDAAAQALNDAIEQLAKKHILTKVEAKDATCTADGNKEHWACSECKKLFSDKDGKTETAVTIKAMGHDWTEATCTSPKTCKTCGATEGAALGHQLTKGDVYF